MPEEGTSTGEPAPAGAEPAAAPAPGALVATARSPSFRPGAIIADKYVVERLIGEGGLGVVVAARHTQLEQLVAIKYLRPKALASATLAERFVREARLAAKIRSDHVARVYDVGTLPTGAPYMVMEYLSGMDLGRMLVATGPLPVYRAVDYVLQACDAIAAAHAAGIVHRDIKPENLFVTTGSNGTPMLKVLDFGISKLTGGFGSGGRIEPGQASGITLAGEMAGTPVYMSPEQLQAADDVDGRTDIWAIGVVLYQLLAGRLPFDGETLPELVTAIVSKRPVPLTDLRPDVSLVVARAVERCLAKPREERYQKVEELQQELGPFTVVSREQRVENALRTLDAADKGKLPNPLPDELLTRALRAAPVPSFEDEHWVNATGSGVASWTPPPEVPMAASPPAPQPKKGRAVLWVLGGAAAAAVAALAATVASADHPTAEAERPAAARAAPLPASAAPSTLPAAAPSVAQPVAASEPSPSPTPAPSPAPLAQASTSAAGHTPPGRAPAAAAPPVHAPSKHGRTLDGASAGTTTEASGAPAKATPPPAPPARPHDDPNAVINPFD